MKKFLLRTLNSFKKINSGEKLGIWHYLCLLLIFISFSLPYLAGSYSKSAIIEQLSNDVSDVVKHKTREGKVLGITVGPTQESGSIPRTEGEFYSLYGVFKQQDATYGSGYNVHKEENILIKDIDSTINFSIFHSDIDRTTTIDDHYKHWYFPIEFMFEAERLYHISPYMIYFSQKQADKYLENKNVKKEQNGYTKDDYYSLIKTTFVMTVNNKDYTCVIGNIFYENNYYHNSMQEIMNEYVICAYYCPGDLVRQNIYFFNTYPYQNSYFFDHINKTYSNKLYDVRLVKNNVLDEVDDNYLISFYSNNFQTSSYFYILLVSSILLITICGFMIFLTSKNFMSLKFSLLLLFDILIPYFIFFIIFNKTRSILYFSNSAISFYTYCLIYFVGVMFVLGIVRHIKTNRKKGI